MLLDLLIVLLLVWCRHCRLHHTSDAGLTCCCCYCLLRCSMLHSEVQGCLPANIHGIQCCQAHNLLHTLIHPARADRRLHQPQVLTQIAGRVAGREHQAAGRLSMIFCITAAAMGQSQ